MAAQQESGVIRVRRIYEPPDGGYRVLVDRLWPRGVSKARADLDEVLKDLAPSTELRTRFARDCASRPDTVLLYGARSDGEPGRGAAAVPAGTAAVTGSD